MTPRLQLTTFALVTILCSSANAATAPAVAYLGTVPQSAGQPPVSPDNISSFGMDADSNHYYSDFANGTVIRIAADGARSTIASGLKAGNPQAGLAVDYRGNVCLADPGNHRILTIAAGTSTPVVRAIPNAPHALAVDTVGDCFFLSGTQLYQIPPAGQARAIANIPGAFLIAYGPASGEDDTVYVLSTGIKTDTYSVSTFTYHNGAGTAAVDRTFTSSATISSFVVDATRNLILATESGNVTNLSQVSPAGQVDVLTSTQAGDSPFLALDYNRNLFYMDRSGIYSIQKSNVNFGSIEAPYGGSSFFSSQEMVVAVPPGATVTTFEQGNFADNFDPSTDCGWPGNVCHITVNFIPGDMGIQAGTFVVQDENGVTLASVSLYGTGLYPVSNIFVANGGFLSTPLYTATADTQAVKSAVGLSPTNANLEVVVTDVGTGSVVTPFFIGSKPVTGLGKPQTVVQYPSTTYVTQTGMSGVLAIDNKGVRTRMAQRLAGEPNDVAVDIVGNLYIADHNSVFRIGIDGTETSLADPGNDGGYERADSIAVDNAGDVYTFFHTGGPSGNGGLIRISPAGVITPLTPPDGVRAGTSMALDSGGGLYISDGVSKTMSTLRTDDVSLTLISGLKVPKGISGYNRPAIIDQGTDSYVQPYLPDSAFRFGDVPVGHTVTRTFTLVATGNEASTVHYDFSDYAGDPEFTLSSHEIHIAPGASAFLTITFTPTAPGLHTAAVNTFSNDFNAPDGGSETITLTGTGVTAH